LLVKGNFPLQSLCPRGRSVHCFWSPSRPGEQIFKARSARTGKATAMESGLKSMGNQSPYPNYIIVVPSAVRDTILKAVHDALWSFRPLAVSSQVVSSPSRFIPVTFRPLHVSSPTRTSPENW
jgi:hypothetical protein